MNIADTQILSYYFKAAAPLPSTSTLISSISAAEFLLVHSGSPNGANYFPILPTRIKHRVGVFLAPGLTLPRASPGTRGAAFGKRMTDQLILDFNGKLPSYVEYGSVAISQIINDGHEQIFSASIAHLDKASRKKLRNKLRFLLDADVQCLPVTPAIAGIGMNILGRFLDDYEMKQNHRNSINDILILATAVAHSVPLLTEDGLLKRFTAELLGAPCADAPPNMVIIDFALPQAVDRRKPYESKGYVNRGWQVLARRCTR